MDRIMYWAYQTTATSMLLVGGAIAWLRRALDR